MIAHNFSAQIIWHFYIYFTTVLLRNLKSFRQFEFEFDSTIKLLHQVASVEGLNCLPLSRCYWLAPIFCTCLSVIQLFLHLVLFYAILAIFLYHFLIILLILQFFKDFGFVCIRCSYAPSPVFCSLLSVQVIVVAYDSHSRWLKRCSNSMFRVFSYSQLSLAAIVGASLLVLVLGLPACCWSIPDFDIWCCLHFSFVKHNPFLNY